MPASCSTAAAATNRRAGRCRCSPGWRRSATAARRSGRRRPSPPTGSHDLAQQADAVLHRAAVGVGAVVGAVAQEFVDQVAVGGVDLHAVEPGLERVAGGAAIILEQGRDLVRPQRPRLVIRLLALIGVGRVRRRGGRRGDRRLAAEEIRMHQAPHVPELGGDAAAGLVDRRRDGPPGRDLLRIPQARRIRPAQALLADAGGFGDDQAGTGPLGVILGHQRRRHVLPRGPPPGQRRHDDPVRRRDGAERMGSSRLGIEVLPSGVWLQLPKLRLSRRVQGPRPW